MAGSPGYGAWREKLKLRNTLVFDATLPVFGYAKVILPQGPGIGAYAVQPVGMTAAAPAAAVEAAVVNAALNPAAVNASLFQPAAAVVAPVAAPIAPAPAPGAALFAPVAPVAPVAPQAGFAGPVGV